MKRLSDDDETVLLVTKVPTSTKDRVVEHQRRARLRTQSEATRDLLEKALAKEEAQ